MGRRLSGRVLGRLRHGHVGDDDLQLLRAPQQRGGRSWALSIQLVPDGFNRTIQTHESGRYTRIGYDELGERIWSSLHAGLPNGAYGPPQWGQGNLRKAEDITYDAIGRPKQRRQWHFNAGVAVGDGYATTTIAYNAATRSTTVTDDASFATTYTMDVAGRLKKVVLPTGAVVTQQYLDGGREVTRTWPAPTPSGQRTETTGLTAWGAIASVETTDAGGTALLDSYEYDEHSRLVAATDGTGKGTTITYDAFDRPRLETQVRDGVAIETVELGWNRNEWPTFRISDGGVSEATTKSDFTTRSGVCARRPIRSKPSGRRRTCFAPRRPPP